jgi:phosphoribosylcarboxyaminoimidazole (NCAIR) mutase
MTPPRLRDRPASALALAIALIGLLAALAGLVASMLLPLPAVAAPSDRYLEVHWHP